MSARSLGLARSKWMTMSRPHRAAQPLPISNGGRWVRTIAVHCEREKLFEAQYHSHRSRPACHGGERMLGRLVALRTLGWRSQSHTIGCDRIRLRRRQATHCSLRRGRKVRLGVPARSRVPFAAKRLVGPLQQRHYHVVAARRQGTPRFRGQPPILGLQTKIFMSADLAGTSRATHVGIGLHAGQRVSDSAEQAYRIA